MIFAAVGAKAAGSIALGLVKNYWKELLAIVALAFVVWNVYAYGYDKGVVKVEAKYAIAIAAAEKEAKQKSVELEKKVLELQTALDETNKGIEGRIQNEKAISGSIIARLSKRLRDCSGSSSQGQSSSDSSGVDELARYAEVAEFNYNAALKNYKQVNGLQVYTYDLLEAVKHCTDQTNLEYKKQRQSAQQRLEELKNIK